MSFGEGLVSPHFWFIFAVLFACGWYAKRSWYKGFFFALIAPLILGPMWIMLCVVLAIPRDVVEMAAPQLIDWFGTLPGFVQFVFHPCTVISMIGYFIFCRSERETSHLVPATAPSSRREPACANPLRRKMLP